MPLFGERSPTVIKTDNRTLPKFRQAIYDEFDVRMPAKTLKTLVTVKKLTEYLEESLEGYEEKSKKPQGDPIPVLPSDSNQPPPSRARPTTHNW